MFTRENSSGRFTQFHVPAKSTTTRDRVTGKPIYGVEERPVPQSEVPLERSSRTQPFPLKPAPLSRMTMKPEDVATVTPELEAACRKLMDGVQMGGPYLPQAYKRLRV